MDDRELLELLRARSESAVSALSDTYGAYCRTIAFRILQNDEDVQECLNDVYWKIWTVTATKDIHDLKYYVASVTRNTAVDMYNKNKAERYAERELAVFEELQECFGSCDDVVALTDAIVITDTLNAFLATLPTQERWVFMRRYWNMDGIRQIASACGKREDAVRKMLSRTRQKLKIQLEKEGIIL